jgi:hypothetical protein
VRVCGRENCGCECVRVCECVWGNYECVRVCVCLEGNIVVVGIGFRCAGTIDITQFVVLHPAPLAVEELRCASGGGWGSGEIDALFESFLEDLLGAEGWAKVTHMTRVRLHREWVRDVKEVFRPEASVSTYKVELAMALEDAGLVDEPGLKELCDEYNRVKGLAGSDAAIRTRDRGKTSLRLPHAFVRARFFDPVVDRIRLHVSEELALMRGEGLRVDYILLAGGFAECTLLAEALKDVMGADRVLVPESPSRAVAYGAVLQGASPHSVVRARRARYAVCYGRYDWFDPERDRADKLYRDAEGRDLARDRAIVVFRKNELLRHGDPTAAYEDHTVPLRHDQKTLGVRFLKWDGEGDPPRYWTDDGFTPLGSVTVDIASDAPAADRPAGVAAAVPPADASPEERAKSRLADKAVKIRVDFSGPEIAAFVISERTGDVKRVPIRYE